MRFSHAITIAGLLVGLALSPPEPANGWSAQTPWLVQMATRLATPAAAAEVSAVAVAREGERNFVVSRAGSPRVRVTFLTPQAFRVHALGAAPAAVLPDYIRVKRDDAYPQVQVDHAVDGRVATFKTEAVTLALAVSDDGALLNVTAGGRALVKNWAINAKGRTASIDLDRDEHIYGFGDKRAALDQRGHKIEMRNRDAFASETNESYKNIPFYISSAGYGLFFHNVYPSTFDIGTWFRSRLQITATTGDMDFYMFVGLPKEVLSQYTELTGRPAMLPRWAFGYHQAKASYGGRDAFTVAAEMRKRKLPLDVIYYDDWDEDSVEKDFIASLWSRHRVRVTHGFGMPMFGRYPGTDDTGLLDDLGARKFLMVDETGQPAIAPDQHVDNSEANSAVGYVDYFSSAAVDYLFKEKWDDALDDGVILGMIDFGELDHIKNPDRKFWPSVGLSVEQTRNLYGLVYPLSIIDRIRERTGARITGMVRPGTAGSQRLGWSTTGDSVPTYRNFRAHTRGMINLTLSGFSNVGQDIGGWERKGPDILYARWFAAGTFNPFMWSHGQGDHEPYAHGETVEQAAREFLNLRYRLIPYLYSLHEVAHRTGVPALRSFPLQEAADRNAYRIDDQYFLGDDLMIAPLFNDEGDRKIYLPKGLWYDFFSEAAPERGGRDIERRTVPLDRLPVYVRAGAVIPLGPQMQYSSEKPVDPLTVHIFGFDGDQIAAGEQTSAFSLYEDDGQSDAYTSGKFQRTRLSFTQREAMVRVAIDAQSGDGRYRSVPARSYDVRMHGVRAPLGGVRLDGKEIARADDAASGRSSARWRVDDKTGDVVISIPRSAARALVVEFATAAGWSCGGSC